VRHRRFLDLGASRASELRSRGARRRDRRSAAGRCGATLRESDKYSSCQHVRARRSAPHAASAPVARSTRAREISEWFWWKAPWAVAIADAAAVDFAGGLYWTGGPSARGDFDRLREDL